MAVPEFDVIRPNHSVDATGRILTAISTEWTSYCAQATTDKKSSGKWYFEISIDTSYGIEWMIIGVAQADTITFPGANANSCGYMSYETAARRLINGAERIHGPDYSRGVPVPIIIGIAIDLGTGKVFFSSNGLWRRNFDSTGGNTVLNESLDAAATLAAGVDTWPAVGLPYINQSVHANWAAEDLVYDPPTGYSAWEIVDPHLSGYFEIVNDIYMGGNLQIMMGDSVQIQDSFMVVSDSTSEVSGSLQIANEDAPRLSGFFDIAYNSYDRISDSLKIVCDIVGTRLSGSLQIIYNISDLALISGSLQIVCEDDSSVVSSDPIPTCPVSVGGNILEISEVSVEFNRDEYCGSCSLSLVDRNAFNLVSISDPVQAVHLGTTFNFVVYDIPSSESVDQIEMKLLCKSPAILSDFPYSDPVDPALFPDLASSVVTSIFSSIGLSFTWNIPADEVIYEDYVSVAGSSPLSCARAIVNEFGGVLISNFDGSMVARPKRSVNTGDYATATISKTFDINRDVESLETSFIKNTGNNKYFVFNESLSEDYRLEYEEITKGSGKVMAYKTPWDGVPKQLITSETTNVTIRSMGEVSRVIENEEIEIVKGTGSTEFPCYGVISAYYDDRISLGALAVDETGNFTTATVGDSMVKISYTTKCFEWLVSGTDPEKVQFSLMEQ